MKLAEWLSFSGLPAMLLVFGTIQELQKPLDIRVCCDAVWTSGRRRIPVDRLRGAKLEEGPATVRLRRPEPQSKRFWFVVRKRSLADCDHFKSAVQAILRSQEVEEPGS